MILEYISTPELNFQKSWGNGLKKIRTLSKFDKYMTIFWLLGPFVYLIERDPADLWISLICCIFLFRCFIKKDWGWASQFWFKCALALWLWGLFSAIIGSDTLFNFQQGFVWIRFPLYAVAAQAWVARDRDIRVIMLLSMMLGMIIMCCILIAETLSEYKTRLSWPYGDIVPGGYLAKFCLPLFCVLIAMSVSKKGMSGFIFQCISLLTISVTGLTGERGNFIIKVCSGLLSSLIWKPRFLLCLMLILIQFLIVLFFATSRSDLSDRYGKNLIKAIPVLNTSVENPYWGAWRSGIQQALKTPVIGIGPSGTRNTCKNLEPQSPSWLPGKNYCGNHPHNFYIQLLAETGLIGFSLGCMLFYSIIFCCYKARKLNLNCPISATAFVVPLALFFPMQQFGSFYGQWGNLFTWFAIGFAISQHQDWVSSKK